MKEREQERVNIAIERVREFAKSNPAIIRRVNEQLSQANAEYCDDLHTEMQDLVQGLRTNGQRVQLLARVHRSEVELAIVFPGAAAYRVRFDTRLRTIWIRHDDELHFFGYMDDVAPDEVCEHFLNYLEQLCAQHPELIFVD